MVSPLLLAGTRSPILHQRLFVVQFYKEGGVHMGSGVGRVGALGKVYHFLRIFYAAGAMASFSTNDMGVKWLGANYPPHQSARGWDRT